MQLGLIADSARRPTVATLTHTDALPHAFFGHGSSLGSFTMPFVILVAYDDHSPGGSRTVALVRGACYPSNPHHLENQPLCRVDAALTPIGGESVVSLMHSRT